MSWRNKRFQALVSVQLRKAQSYNCGYGESDESHREVPWKWWFRKHCQGKKNPGLQTMSLKFGWNEQMSRWKSKDWRIRNPNIFRHPHKWDNDIKILTAKFWASNIHIDKCLNILNICCCFRPLILMLSSTPAARI